MATYVLIHGAGGTSWSWHLVTEQLEARGHEVIAVDLPCDDDTAGFVEYRDAALAAIGERTDVIVVAHSLGGFTAPLLCDRVRVELMVLVAAMVPAPGESGGEWWTNTGWAAARAAEVEIWDGEDDPFVTFLHDLPPDLAAESGVHMLEQSGTPFEKPWPLLTWPDVPTRFLVCRDDRFFPANFMRRVVRERLGIVPDELGSGHLPMLSRPVDLTEYLERCRVEEPA
jgi:pimeloyl-ACP methyl ester carboxylesterase